MLRRILHTALIAPIAMMVAAAPAAAIEIRKAGRIELPAGAMVVPFSTDPTIAGILRQDFQVEHRGAAADTAAPLTLSVSVSERPLRPGVSLADLAPGDPDIAALLKSAGATPPPVGDTGIDPDEAALARARERNRLMPPGASPMQQIFNQFQESNPLGPVTADPSGCVPGAGPCVAPQAAPTPRPVPGSPGYTGDTQEYLRQGYEAAALRPHLIDDGAFDNVIVARVSLSGSSGEMTVIAVSHPGEDQRTAKKLVAEEIANALLH